MLNNYRGRFAPAPTGPLHLGSLLTAVASFLDARQHNGRWLVRIEDLDTPRVVAGADSVILNNLEQLGLYWDGSVMYQSQRQTAYQTAFTELHTQQYLFPCACSRKRTKGKPYDGRCRNGLAADETARAWRVRITDAPLTFTDAIQGEYVHNLADSSGDFIIKRSDGLFAYQLAVVVDDAAQGVTHVLRGVDLLDSTPRQIYLQQLLQIDLPQYLHVPILVNADGKKLSKQHHSPAIECEQPLPMLWQVLTWLGQQPPAELLAADLDSFWQWAIAHWDVTQVPKVTQLME